MALRVNHGRPPGDDDADGDSAGIPAGDESFEAIDIDSGRAVTGQECVDSPGIANNGRAIVFDAMAGDYN